ncbi:amidase [Sphingomonas yunnanensis]|uniref:amidase n=1 Tax=Sphingomonas yunnanensis TaxID=310400 RepID=UPI001CA72776|nr:amidase [Sphingomonas yunnanensis]MBY9064349.1 amidase [Sphingomonas yunnanensis]
MDDGDDISAFLSSCEAGRNSAGAAVAACLARIAAHDRVGLLLSAMLRVSPDAQDVARDRDGARRRGERLGALHGVPIAVKDNIDLAGMPTTSGCRALAAALPWRTAPALDVLLAAGAIVVGKTNLSEFSFEIRSRSSLGGDTRNPFAPAVTSGGSSGGTAVAVAAGFALAGLGTDTGGSIRVPAAYNGLVGLRPTWGVIPTAGVAPLAPSTDTVGTITRSVNDAETIFGLLAAPTSLLPVPFAGMRVGILSQLLGSSAEIDAGIDNAIAALRAAGVEVAVAPDLPNEVLPRGAHIVDEEFGSAFDAYLGSNFRPGTAPDSVAAVIAERRFLLEYEEVLRARAAPRSNSVRAAILALHAELRGALARVMDRYGFDALLYPPSAVLPSSMDNPKGGWAPELAACSGWPALALPVGRTSGGMPLSAELLARPHAETTLFALSRVIEASAPRPTPTL